MSKGAESGPEFGHEEFSESDRDRFWVKVGILGEDDCRNWKAGSGEYGIFWLNRRSVSAHRVAYVLGAVKTVPKGMLVIHSCDNPKCCNPKHLKIGTVLDNEVDKRERGRHSRGERHGMAKLSKRDVKQIRSIYAAGGYLQKELALLFGVKRATIKSIILRKSWRHVS